VNRGAETIAALKRCLCEIWTSRCLNNEIEGPRDLPAFTL
jgi:hypothetical protein